MLARFIHSKSVNQSIPLFYHPTGEDYTISGGTIQILTFGDLEIQKEINVTSLHDDIGEGDEVIILDLINDETNFIDVNIGQSTTQITILEDDGKHNSPCMSFNFAYLTYR